MQRRWLGEDSILRRRGETLKATDGADGHWALMWRRRLIVQCSVAAAVHCIAEPPPRGCGMPFPGGTRRTPATSMHWRVNNKREKQELPLGESSQIAQLQADRNPTAASAQGQDQDWEPAEYGVHTVNTDLQS